MKKNKKEIILYVVLLISLIMANPPVLNLVNDYAKANPLTLGFPTLWVWLEFWYIIAMAAFLIAAITFKSWKKEY